MSARSPTMLLKADSSNQQHQYHLGVYEKCRFPGLPLSPDLPIRISGWEQICFNKASWRFSNSFKLEDPLAWENCLTTIDSLSILCDDTEKLKKCKNFEDSDQYYHLLHIKFPGSLKDHQCLVSIWRDSDLIGLGCSQDVENFFFFYSSGNSNLQP